MLLDHLMQIKDVRRKQAQKYDLGTILFLCILASASNANSYRKFHTFIEGRFDMLQKELGFNWLSAPSYSTIRYVILGVSTDDLEKAFRKDAIDRLNEMRDPDESIALSFDGKTAKGSFDNFAGKNAIQILSVFSNKYKLILAHEKVEEKTNEIPVAQALIPKLPFQDVIYTCDAINCQEKTIRTIVETDNNFVVQVKDNQKHLLEDCKKIAEVSVPLDVYTEPIEKEHGRITSRTAKIFDPSTIRNADGKWQNIKCIVQIERKREVLLTKEKLYKDTSETSYYVSTKKITAESLNSIIRGHWGIENSNHYVKDVTFGEDASRIRVKPQNMIIFKSIALNILRSNGIKNIARQLYANSINLNNLLKLKI